MTFKIILIVAIWKSRQAFRPYEWGNMPLQAVKLPISHNNVVGENTVLQLNILETGVLALVVQNSSPTRLRHVGDEFWTTRVRTPVSKMFWWRTYNSQICVLCSLFMPVISYILVSLEDRLDCNINNSPVFQCEDWRLIWTCCWWILAVGRCRRPARIVSALTTTQDHGPNNIEEPWIHWPLGDAVKVVISRHLIENNNCDIGLWSYNTGRPLIAKVL